MIGADCRYTTTNVIWKIYEDVAIDIFASKLSLIIDAENSWKVPYSTATGHIFIWFSHSLEFLLMEAFPFSYYYDVEMINIIKDEMSSEMYINKDIV